MATGVIQCAGESGPVALQDVERELAVRLKSVQQPGEAPVQRACLSNLIIFSNHPERAAEVAAEVPRIFTLHPARALLLVSNPGPQPGELTATVWVRACKAAPGRHICSEQVTLRADGQAVARLPFAVRGLLVGDLPTNLWWASSDPPPLAGALLFDLTEHAQQVIYDSIGWVEPARGVVAVAAWLTQFENRPSHGEWRAASDLNWRRLKSWRRLLTQALDPSSAPGALDSITEVQVEHGPHAVIQAWELASWLACRLGWRVQSAGVQPGVEISWNFAPKTGTHPVRVRIRRLAEGPSDVRRVRIACSVGGKPGALNAVVEENQRLSVVPEGVQDAKARTLTLQPKPVSELVARQLADRERDPVFHESMAVAAVLARSVLRGV